MLKLAEVMPDTTRATSSNGRVLASAMTRKSRPRPRLEIRITGRRPKRSDSAPWIGVHTNCTAAKQVLMTNTQCVASTKESPAMCLMSCGSTGMTTPKASTSISTVTKMKASAARRPDGAAESGTGAGELTRAGPGSRGGAV